MRSISSSKSFFVASSSSSKALLSQRFFALNFNRHTKHHHKTPPQDTTTTQSALLRFRVVVVVVVVSKHYNLFFFQRRRKRERKSQIDFCRPNCTTFCTKNLFLKKKKKGGEKTRERERERKKTTGFKTLNRTCVFFLKRDKRRCLLGSFFLSIQRGDKVIINAHAVYKVLSVCLSVCRLRRRIPCAQRVPSLSLFAERERERDAQEW